ncbi:MAG: plastocyanin/azurin family copper-binding protein [Gaiellaceae bacterium MAG52_C11]|nr:plastocyanin/azurin family copper-binding protein [Candidatus Gaiellasilicea maunaloa]
MTRTRLAFAVTLSAVGLAVAGCGGDDDDNGDAVPADETTEESAGGGEVTGTVGPGFDISMSGTDELAPGAVTITITDNASNHNFHLTGPGVDEATDVGGEGEESFDVTLEAGEYTFVCDPHASSMNGTFTVE